MATQDPLAGTRPTRPRRENALLELFRIPVFRRIWAAIAFSSLGDWLGLLANTALAQQLTLGQSRLAQGAAISGVILVRLAPDLVFGAVAAAVADKLDRRKTVIAGELTAATLYASIAIGYNLLWLYIAQFIIEAAGLFTQPAKQVIWVSIVPKRLLATANQISLVSVYGAVPIASGVFALLSAVNRIVGGPQATAPGHVNTAIVIALMLNTVTFLVSASTVFLSRDQIPVVPSRREQEQGIVSLLREGVSFVRDNALIRGLYVGIIGAFAAGGLIVGVAQLWVATLSAGAAGYAVMFGTVFTGLAIGMLIGPRVLPSLARSRVFGMVIGAAGGTLLIMSVIRNLVLATGLAALVGAFAGMAWIIGYTLIGQEVEDRLRGRIFAFVLSSVRIILLLAIAAGPNLAGLIGSHAIPVGDKAHLRFSGPGMTLLIGGVLAVLVSLYATSRAAPTRTRVRDLLRRRLIDTAGAGYPEHTGLLISVDGLDRAATSAYADLVVAEIQGVRPQVLRTAEPTDSAVGHRLTALQDAATSGAGVPDLEPESFALLSAADRAEHVATVIRPALDRGEVVVCDQYLLSSLAFHGGGLGADVDRVRAVNSWGTGALLPDLTFVVEPTPVALPDAPADATAADTHAAPGAETVTGIDPTIDSAIDSGIDTVAAGQVLLESADADPRRHVVCPAVVPERLPDEVRDRLLRLVAEHASLLVNGDALVLHGPLDGTGDPGSGVASAEAGTPSR